MREDCVCNFFGTGLVLPALNGLAQHVDALCANLWKLRGLGYQRQNLTVRPGKLGLVLHGQCATTGRTDSLP